MYEDVRCVLFRQEECS